MKARLQWLLARREARRDRALAALAEARARCDRLAADSERARLGVTQCWRWRSGLLSRCALGRAPVDRTASLPACEALLQQRQAGWAQAVRALRDAQDDLAARRAELASFERALLRLREGQALVDAQDTRERRHCEELQDEESAAVDWSLQRWGRAP